jgi:hypothetical protein
MRGGVGGGTKAVQNKQRRRVNSRGDSAAITIERRAVAPNRVVVVASGGDAPSGGAAADVM